jgi:hypothetical protein
MVPLRSSARRLRRTLCEARRWASGEAEGVGVSNFISGG